MRFDWRIKRPYQDRDGSLFLEEMGGGGRREEGLGGEEGVVGEEGGRMG